MDEDNIYYVVVTSCVEDAFQKKGNINMEGIEGWSVNVFKQLIPKQKYCLITLYRIDVSDWVLIWTSSARASVWWYYLACFGCLVNSLDKHRNITNINKTEATKTKIKRSIQTRLHSDFMSMLSVYIQFYSNESYLFQCSEAHKTCYASSMLTK